ncbi:MAG: YraN family protein [Arenimonas sp.]
MAATGADRAQLGATAEDAALAHLRAAGLQLLARNVRYPFGELDLVMREGATLAFVEVRFRRGNSFGGAAASVDAGKRRKLARAAQAWLGAHRAYASAPCRFDVVAVSPGANAGTCEWIRAAFTLDDLW